MIVVAYLYNTNGMASWCWEAAHALAEAGQSVVLVCTPEAKLPETDRIEIVRFEPPQSAASGNRVTREMGRLSGKPSGFVFHLDAYFQQNGVTPSAYLLNQSNLLDTRVRVPQFVVAWAYPTTLTGYLSKIGTLSRSKFSLSTIRTILDAIGWWRKDWYAYRNAAGVLAVSKRLCSEIAAKGVQTTVVHPGTALGRPLDAATPGQPYKILTVALNLEEKRKRVRWLLEALHHMPDWTQFSLTLIGEAGTEFQAWATRDGFPAEFIGPLPRTEVQERLSGYDLFLFGSALDDWGYVLSEAMSHGLCAVAPNLSPFDEIVAETGVLYSPYSQQDLQAKLTALFGSDITRRQAEAQSRAETLFSRHAFANSLLSAISDHMA